jgi:hypothetical protein
MKVWNYTVRLFLPRSEILDGMDIPQGTACELRALGMKARRVPSGSGPIRGEGV